VRQEVLLVRFELLLDGRQDAVQACQANVQGLGSQARRYDHCLVREFLTLSMRRTQAHGAPHSPCSNLAPRAALYAAISFAQSDSGYRSPSSPGGPSQRAAPASSL
jgi:hypothetical protein